MEISEEYDGFSVHQTLAAYKAALLCIAGFAYDKYATSVAQAVLDDPEAWVHAQRARREKDARGVN